MQHGWKPVETAPNGEVALFSTDHAGGHGYTIPRVCRRIDTGDGTFEVVDESGLKFTDATVWHPLPELPERKKYLR